MLSRGFLDTGVLRRLQYLGFDVYMLEFRVSLFGYEAKMGTNNKINVIISLYTLSQVV